MTEWLMSCHNSKESSGVATPLSQTMLADSVDKQLNWFLEQLAGDISHFDRTLRPIEIVQSQGYGNMTYYSRNMSSVLPTDPESVGVPPELITMAKVPALRMAALPGRFIKVAKWTTRYHQTDFAAVRDDLHRRYWDLRDHPQNPLPRIWELFTPEFRGKCALVDRGRILAAVMVMVLDNVLRKQEASLMGLFTGMETSTSLLGQRIWGLREIAAQCGPTITEKLQQGLINLDLYADLPEAAPLLLALQAFLRDYGHRGFENELDFESDRLADRPDMILLAIAGQLQQSEPPRQRSQAVQQNAQEALDRVSFVTRGAWKKALHWGQNVIGNREDFKSAMALSQALVGLAARHLARHFYPQYPDDLLFFYTWEEFMDFTTSRGKNRVPIEQLDYRRAELELHRNQPPPPELIWYDPETKHWRPAQKEATSAFNAQTRRFTGIPASPGNGPVEGIAVVTNNPIEAGRHLLEMDGPAILVTRLTDPAWSSLFARLTAVVTELGGVISHAAIVARENGLPAVVGVPEVTQWVRNGQRLRVDGSTGVLEILD